jgi:hypothetical protein
MEKSLKNIITLLLIVASAAAGYYFFVVKDAADLVSGNSALSQELFADVQRYAERRQTISRIQLDTQIFSDTRFRSLQTFNIDGVTPPQNRANPFDVVNTRNN